jgi:hypothetical protein
MIREFNPEARPDASIAPELAPLNLQAKPDGFGAAAFISAGVGVFMLGVFTTHAVISSGVKSFHDRWALDQGVGPLAGKSTVSVIIWLITWAVLYLMWRKKDANLKTAFYIGAGLGVLGVIGTFPPFFELFH